MLKKILLTLVACAIVGVLAGGAYLYKQKTTITASGPEILTPTLSPQVAGATIEGPTATLVKESGTVEYQLPQTSTFIQLSQDQLDIPSGTTVKTAEDSLAHVVFENNSLMSISSNSQLIVNFEENTISIKQILGNTWHRVEKVLQGDAYSVETPNTLATVRGTEFNVGVNAEQQSEVYVMESVVDVSKVATDSSIASPSSEVKKVTKDKHVVITDDKKPIKMVAMSAEKKNTAWFKRNKQITTEIETAQKEMTKGASDSAQLSTDTLKKKVIRNLMKNLKEDEEIKKIDDQFAPKGKVKGISTSIFDSSTPKPTTTPQPTQTPNNNPPTIPTETPIPKNNTTPNPTMAPTSSPIPTATKRAEQATDPTSTPTETQTPTPAVTDTPPVRDPAALPEGVEVSSRVTIPDGEGHIIYYTTVYNTTEADISPLDIPFNIPEGLVFLMAKPSAGNYNADTEVWNIEKLPAKSSYSLYVMLGVPGHVNNGMKSNDKLSAL